VDVSWRLAEMGGGNCAVKGVYRGGGGLFAHCRMREGAGTILKIKRGRGRCWEEKPSINHQRKNGTAPRKRKKGQTAKTEALSGKE